MIELLQQRLAAYQAADGLAEEQALKEILQELVLYALWRNGFFEQAAFQGGTSLRILYGLPRFSEDMDFILIEPDDSFAWRSVAAGIEEVLLEFGVTIELTEPRQAQGAVRRTMVKDDSLAGLLQLGFRDGAPGRKLRVKLEIDTRPPLGSGWERHFPDFPADFLVVSQDLPSNFALKLHALLCRPYLKGRDWFDFLWYVRRGVQPNLKHLGNALEQYGAWAGRGVHVEPAWLKQALGDKIEDIDWSAAAKDVEPFLSESERHSLQLWGREMFRDRLNRLIPG
ncbi:nucleotidyl transferase AbiEii/AbiGii toxin family protein [Wenzhouxiangella sp. EGI_FJ10409]|uniref:nucleotidyl transferase AbiEii/AbiGii toxin family protein n=1 Tax=Wenzhouxiangella sp. EGI_FJ10409 TaxID=3243767 RepID=UPI0035D5E23A